MREDVFRKKSLDRVKSPENLNEYIHVTNVSLWVLLIAIVVLLLGVCIWGSVGTIEVRTSLLSSVMNGEITCQADSELVQNVQERLDAGEVVEIEMDNVKGVITACDDVDAMLDGTIELSDRTGFAELIEKIKPMSLLFD